MLANLSKILNVKGGGFNGTSWYNQKEKEEKEEKEKEMICIKCNYDNCPNMVKDLCCECDYVENLK